MYNQIFRALAHEHRRQLLRSLEEHDPQTKIPAIGAVHRAAIDEDTLKIAMIHNHLPVLEECGLIKWDQANHRVMRGVNFEEIRPILEAIPDESDNK